MITCNGIRHFGFYVNDVKTPQKFFELLGFNTIYESQEFWLNEFGMIDVVKMRKDKQTIEFVKPAHFIVPFRQSHIALTVDNCEKTYKECIDNLAVNVVSPGLSPDKTVKVAFVEAPGNILIELVEEI